MYKGARSGKTKQWVVQMRVQVRLSDKANEIAAIFKIKNKLKTKAEAVNKIIELSGGTL